MSNGKRIPPIEIRHAQILWPNFEGRKEKFNDEGRRNFCLLIDDETADKLIEQGWRVKYLKPREEGDSPQPYLKVKVSYMYKPPVVDVIVGNKMSHLNEDTIYLVDTLDIDYCDLVLNGSWNEMPDGNKGYTAYLQEIYIHAAVSRLAKEYAEEFREDMENSYADHGQYCNGDCASCPENV